MSLLPPPFRHKAHLELHGNCGRTQNHLPNAHVARRRIPGSGLPPRLLHPAIGAPSLLIAGANDCLIGRSRNGSSSAGAKRSGTCPARRSRSACRRWADRESPNLGRIWGRSVVGAQYCCGFTQPDVCPIPPEHPLALRSALGRIRYPV
jgi:hypothetical protein